ncbi:MAG: polysaccharide biosynthesis tyrosine autokinase [Polyangiaceae bacterium]|nr:polysaccharide biosynthesis tyrosine autokinase [Polyangiaceae bacterium]
MAHTPSVIAKAAPFSPLHAPESKMAKKSETRPETRKKRGTDTPKAEQDLGAMSLGWLVRALRKSWHVLVAAFFLGGGISLLYSKTLPKVYEASALVEFVPDVVRPLGNKDDSSRFWGMFMDNREYYETQYSLITSDLVLSKIVKDLNLQSDPAFLGYKPDKPVPIDDATAMLRERVRVDPLKTSRLVYVRCEDTNPDLAVKLCDAVAKGYVSQNKDKQMKGTTDAAEWLSTQLEHFRGELETNENQLHEFKKSNDLPSSTPDEVSKMIRLEMQHYDEALTRTRTRKQELQARVAELNKVTQNPEQLPASELLGNAFLTSLRGQYQNAQRERRELLAEGKGENHPLVKKADEKLSQAKMDLLEEVKNIQGSVSRDLAVLERQEAGESMLYEAARKHAVDLNLKELEYHRLDRARVQNEKLYGVLLDQMKEADLARMMNVETVRVVDHPVKPKEPVRPKIPSNVAIGLAVGLLVGLGLAILREQLDNSVRTPEDVEGLGVTFLGLLPQLNSVGIGRKGKKPRRVVPTGPNSPPELLVHDQPFSALAEAARTVRTNLLFMNPDHPHRVILVTSAAPSEGKTTVACSIAISMAQGGQRVCIVDCDLRRPRLHRLFERTGDGGVTTILVGDATIEDVAIQTHIENLYCIPSGPIPPNPADLLHSEKFKKFIKDLGEKFDRVIIDSPPVAAVADSAIISTLTDGCVFVIRAFSTTRQLATQGLRSLFDVDAPMLGAVLNAVDLDKQHSYYQYYYYKREGYGPRDGGAGRIGRIDPGAEDAPSSPPN